MLQMLSCRMRMSLVQSQSLFMVTAPIFLSLSIFQQVIRYFVCKGKGRATAWTHTLNLLTVITPRLVEAKSTLWTFYPHIVIAYVYYTAINIIYL